MTAQFREQAFHFTETKTPTPPAMTLLSFTFSVIHGLLLLLFPTFTFLWIIGKLKSIREQNGTIHTHQQYVNTSTNAQPSPSNEHLQPRRLSFSSAVTTNTPTPNPKRRVTFSLTPEQQANELLKTAVRRREALPCANHVIQNHSPQYTQPLQPLVAHLFPSPSHSSNAYNPSTRNMLPSLNHQPISIEQPKPRPRNPANQLTQPLPMRRSPPNNFQNPLSKRHPSQRKPLPRPTSPPPYAANLIRQSRPAFHQTNRNPTGDVSPAKSSDIRLFNPNLTAHNHRSTPSSDSKPPKPHAVNSTPNGFLDFQRTENGIFQRSVR